MLPDWPSGTVTILATMGDSPRAIPVSAALRAGPKRVLLGLAAGRGSLARLRAEPRVALAVISRGVAMTLYGTAKVIDEALVEGVAAVEIQVDELQEHDRPTFEIEAGISWRWTDSAAGIRDAEVRTALQRLAR